MEFRSRLLDSQPAVIYSTVPPRRGTSDAAMYRIAEKLAARLQGLPVDAINIPEVWPENSRNGDPRPYPYVPTREPREYAKILGELTGKEQIVNVVAPHYGRKIFYLWLFETMRRFDVRNLVLVGGDSSTVAYPGPGVEEAALLAKRAEPNYFLGGIAIPERHRRKGDEPRRMLRKSAAGINFFTTQVVYDPGSAVELIRDYSAECSRSGGQPAPLFLTFSPFSTGASADFLQWLGVRIPYGTNVSITLLELYDKAIQGQLLRRFDLKPAAAKKSAAICSDNLKKILDETSGLAPKVPLHLNVENVSKRRDDIDASAEMVHTLSEIMNEGAKPLVIREALYEAAGD